MSSRSLTVVIPAYNAASSIGPTLDALIEALAAVSSFVAEIVLVDDGSTDGTAASATAAVAERVPLHVISQPNRGRFEARRAGLAAATNDWVLLLDSRVILHPGSLSFLAERLDAGERVWNGHVEVLTDGNPYAAFGKAVVAVAWREYFRAPRTTSFGIEDFDRYPKGTTCFFAPRSLLVDAVAGSHTTYTSDPRLMNDDTPVLRWIAARERIHISPAFSCDYEARSTLRSFVGHSFHRGTVFVDGHLRSESRFFWGAVAFYPLSLLFLATALRRPRVAATAAVAGSLTAGGLAAANGCTASEARATALLAPVYGVAHGAGMWRGLALACLPRICGLRRPA